MAKSVLRLQARKLRAQGKSVKDIATKLGITKSTVSLWVRDIILSVEQLEKLRQKALSGATQAVQGTVPVANFNLSDYSRIPGIPVLTIVEPPKAPGEDINEEG